MEGGGEEEHAVGHRWTRSETVVLANALKAREEEAHDVASKSAVGTAGDKWENISKFCRSHGVTRSGAQCSSRWSKGLYLDYKKVRDWQKKEDAESYWKMKEKKRREHKLPGALDEEVFNILVSFLDPDLKQTGTPESEVDSDRPFHVTSSAPAIDKSAAVPQQAGPSVSAACATPSQISGGSSDGVGSMSDFARLQARATTGESLQPLKYQIGGSPGGDQNPVISGQKRKRASISSHIGAPATADGRVHSIDPPNLESIKPIHFNVPPPLDSVRFNEPTVAERSSTAQWDGPPNLASLEARLGAQSEAIWNRVRMLNEQVVQVVDMSNQRLLGQMQSLFTQIRLQLQVISAQMQANVHEATRSLQAELQSVLQAHTEQICSQVQAHYSSRVPHPQGQAPPKDRAAQNSNWGGDRTPRPTPPDIQVDFSQLPVPVPVPVSLLQPVQTAPDKEKVFRQRTGELSSPAPRTNRLLPHISDVQKAESLVASKTSRLPPHISDVDRILRQQQGLPLPSPMPNWNQASFVISELDRVLGHKPGSLDMHMIPPAPGQSRCTYAVNETDRNLGQRQSADVKMEKAPPSSFSMALSMSSQGPPLWSQGPIHSDVLALPSVSENPNQSIETSSGQDVEPNSRHHPASSDTVDGDETEGSGQDVGASSEKMGGHHTRGGARGRTQPNRLRL
ncbi:uncharacterized protein [Physcomitrium patens]|uniref:Myb-like domain-containing protein n=1 Tax=Physcomitrium patens TaxID=3218 RepID=A9STZ4_PHYPA|nr:uncharacterized protein LOC112289976 [Physcomitrium patens]XP_024391556.1 uncharacterized protein LOC112289976 [Physcomitrium patens]PNR44236.1 hypothetical protein PHYPA_016620 [Physcomitrium patens]|eukprot:XP_024391555.1 uncharacterized protein LOC112289976 [Physcomitrella patens]